MTKDNIDYNKLNPADDLVAEAAGGPGYVEEHSQPNRLSGRQRYLIAHKHDNYCLLFKEQLGTARK